MRILKKIKRLWYRWRNSDPVKRCDVYLTEGCSHVDGMLCNFPDCDIYHKYMKHEWVSCGNCKYQEPCMSKNFGLGCYDGEPANPC